MLGIFLRRVIGKKLFLKPKVMFCVPSGVTDVEQRALIAVFEEAGARCASLIEEPIAAAIGAGLDITSPYGNMIIDIGGGTTDIAVIALGGMIVNESIKIAGDHLTDAIVKYVKKKFNLYIGEKTAEEIKIKVGSAVPRNKNVYIDITGRNNTTGLPTTQRISSEDTLIAFDKILKLIIQTVQNVLNRTPPEHTADIFENGIYLTGGGAFLCGIDRLISNNTGMPCYIANDAFSCVVIGTGEAAETFCLIKNKDIERLN